MLLDALAFGLIWTETMISPTLIVRCFEVIKVAGCEGAGGSKTILCQLFSTQLLSPGQSAGLLRAHMSGPREGRDPDSPNPPLPTSHPSCSVLALWRVNWADLWDRRGGHRRAAFPLEPQTSTLRLEEICSTILWPPAFQGWARTEGRGRDLGGGQAFSSGSSFAPHVSSSTPHWSF